MRIRWTAPDPGDLADRFATRLGFRVAESGAAGAGDLTVDFRSGPIVLAQASGEDERVDGLDVGDTSPGIVGRASPVAHPNGVVDLLGVGWATVDLDRAAREFRSLSFASAPSDGALGARALIAPAQGGAVLVLLEPWTEGRLGASLARFGEGPAVVYVAVPAGALERFATARRRAGERVGPVADGPLGRSVVLSGSRPWGPHLVACELAAIVSPATAQAGTIGS